MVWSRTLTLPAQFELPRFLIYQTICDVLEGGGHITQSIQCFRQMESELAEDTSIHAERAAWELGEGFQR